MDLDIKDAKIELIQWLATLNDVNMIQKLIVLKQENQDWWNSVSDAEKKSIDKGLSDAKNGNLKPHTSAKKVYEKWL